MKNDVSNPGRKGQAGRPPAHDIAFIRKVITHYHQSDMSTGQLARYYGLSRHHVKNWVSRYSSDLAIKEEVINVPINEQEHIDQQALQKQIAVLQKKLEYEQMKNFALETMIDVAKKELGVDIRKNSGAKQPKE